MVLSMAAFVSAVVAAVLPDEQAAMDNTIIDAIAAHNTLFFIISFLLLYRNSRPRTYMLRLLLTQVAGELICYCFDTLSW